MRFIYPTAVTDDSLVSSTVPENDHAEWSGSATYAVGTRVIKTATHRVYESLADSNTGNDPESSPLQWANAGATNRWAMFDSAVGSRTEAFGSLVVVLALGVETDGLGILDVLADTITVEMREAGTVIYSRTVTTADPAVPEASVLLTDMPASLYATVTVTLTGEDLHIGTIALGAMVDIGGTQYGATVGIIDYSAKTTDAFGNTSVVRRAHSKRLNARLAILPGDVDRVARQLAAVRATPVLWIGSDEYQSTVVYGYYRDWSIDIAFPTLSWGTLTIEGLPDSSAEAITVSAGATFTSGLYPVDMATESTSSAMSIAAGSLNSWPVESQTSAMTITGGTLVSTGGGTYTVPFESQTAAMTITGGTLQNALVTYSVPLESQTAAMTIASGTLYLALITTTIPTEEITAGMVISSGTLT